MVYFISPASCVSLTTSCLARYKPFGHCVKSYNPGYVYLWRELGLLNSNFYGVPLYHDLHTLISLDFELFIHSIFFQESGGFQTAWSRLVCAWPFYRARQKLLRSKVWNEKKGSFFGKRGARQNSDRNSHLSPCWYSLARKAALTAKEGVQF